MQNKQKISFKLKTQGCECDHGLQTNCVFIYSFNIIILYNINII